jgi:hypothetical protein
MNRTLTLKFLNKQMAFILDQVPKVLPEPFSLDDPKQYHGFRGMPEDKIWFGVEIELEYTGPKPKNHYDIYDLYDKKYNPNPTFAKNINAINKLVGKFAIIKGDGSLDCGIEIATTPCSYEIQLEQWKEFFACMTKLNLASRKTCGMHVHISRKHFTEDQIYSLRDICKSGQNRIFIEKVSGRKENEYCQFNYDPFSLSNVSHYHAINIQSSKTIEFRIFKAPRTYSEFAKNLEFVRALVDYVRRHDHSHGVHKAEEFYAYLQSQKGKFKNLKTFCTRRKLFKPVKVTRGKKLAKNLMSA